MEEIKEQVPIEEIGEKIIEEKPQTPIIRPNVDKNQMIIK